MFLGSFIIELMAVLLMLTIVLYTRKIGNQEELAKDRGWSLIFSGLVLLLLGAVADLTDHFPALSRCIILGQTPYQSLIAEALGFLGGIVVALGLMRWLPQVAAHRRAAGKLRQRNEKLEANVEASSLELKKAALELEQEQLKRRAAETANAAKSRFVANTSHEVRTRLAAILGLSELLLVENALPATARECADRIHSSADGLASLIGNVLDFSKIEADLLDLHEVDFRLAEVLKKLQAIMAPQAAAKGLELRLEISNDVPALNGDPIRLLQVLVNLVGNAIKFTSEGQVAARLERVSEPNDHGIRIRGTVTDTGPGISTPNLERLFEPFTQADSSVAGKFGGTGLGLTICSSLVELMGGVISVESTPGKGSNFTFTATFSPARDSRATGELPEAPAERDLRRSAILVVEDNEVNRIVILSMLQALGHIAIGVGDGNEALAALEEKGFDLIFMDCLMPELDGYETTRVLRQREASGHRLPVVALTANVMTGERERCLAAGMDDFLAKPVRQSEMSRILDRWLTSP